MKKIIIFILALLSFPVLIISANEYGVGKNKTGERPNVSIKTIEENNGYTIGSDDKRIYLTFDCGYEKGYTLKILDVLKETDTKACFFITGHYLNSSYDIVKRMITDGHTIGNHTYSHKSFNVSSNEEILNDIKKLEDLYKEKTGLTMSKYIRPPKGEYTEKSQKLLADNGYSSIFWSLAYVDWYKDKYYGNHYSYNNVMKKIHNGAIILMHSVSKDNTLDLKDIIIDLKEKGYIFSSLDDLSSR